MNAQRELELPSIERSLRRKLSDVETAALARVSHRLPTASRKRKRMLRVVQRGARKEELRSIVGRRFLEPSAIELSRARELLTLPQPAPSFIQEVERVAKLVPSEKLFGNRYKFLREATPLAEFCRHTNPRAAWLGADPPDAWIIDDLDQERAVEITEILEPGRRRGDEYRRLGVQVGTYVTEADAPERVAQIIERVRTTIAAKASKSYAEKPLLLIYLNTPHHRRDEPDIAEATAALRKDLPDSLADVRVLTDTRLIT